MVTLTIDNKEVTVPKGTTVLEAARQIGVNIPTLCYLKDINEVGACRMCLVEVEGVNNRLLASCVLEAAEGMVVKTNTKKVRIARKNNLELILSNHDRSCLSCERNKNCELQTLADDLGIREITFDGERIIHPIDYSSPSIVRDQNKCILCGRCISVCDKIQNVGVLGFQDRGFKTSVGQPFNKSLDESPCIRCGQCINVCPVGALHEKEEIDYVWDAIESDKHVVVQTAPAVRAALGEEFGLEMGTPVTGKMVAALRRLGFDKVFDTDFAADLTIMEEGYELLDRVQNGGVLPMITSCSPGWINYCEEFYPEFIPNLSSCKSPQNMFGAIAKSYYAEQNGIDRNDIYVVSVMPCTAKKGEKLRDELKVDGVADVDAVITTRELAKMIKTAGIDFTRLEDESCDQLIGESTGAGVIFGVTGGVMEAALRTVAEVVHGHELENVEYTAVRGVEGIKEASVKLGDLEVKIAIAHSTGQASKLLDLVKSGEKEYHFIEIMGCSGGCVNGGGQPIVCPEIRMTKDIRVERAKALYSEDESKTIRKSHENPMIKKLYDEYLGEPNGHKSHHLLHTTYKKKEIYPL
ncbi:MAG: NADH-dependent [FeFe] hydrogenase, group A6 [Tissierellales bacterium]|jgi:NADP-reducing hydrogenase subunit HndD|nr:NADH-dependent [FeFe] hydrogenase, group A6 [Tissierellales bacterium]